MKNVLKGLGRVGQKLLAMLRRNWGYKLVALIFALILWSTVLLSNNPLRTVNLNDMPVSIVGINELQDKKLTTLEAPDSYIASIRAKVSIDVNLNNKSRINENTVTLSVDLSKVVGTGMQELPIVVDAPFDLAQNITVTPSTVTVDVDRYLERSVPVAVQRTGELAGGYWQGDLTVSPQAVVVKGPASRVDKVGKALVTLAMDGIVSDYIGAHSFVLVDDTGAEVDSSAMAFSDSSVMLSLPVRPTKQVSVLYDQAVIGTDMLPDGFETTGTEIYPDTVTIAAPADILAGINGLSMTVVDVAGATADVTATAALNIPDGVKLLEDTSAVEVMVRISEVKTTMTFENVKIAVRGLDDGLSSEPIETRATVTVTGPVNSVKDLLASGVKLYVDASGLTAGTHNLKVFSEIDDRYRVQDTKISVGGQDGVDTLDVVITG